MTIKLSIAQVVLLNTLVKVGPTGSPRKNPSAIRLVELGYAEWEGGRKLVATEKGRAFVGANS